jgi:predicted SprT family Zn-dependent metalloprotease
MDGNTLSKLVRELFAQHGLVGWSFGLNRAKRQLGVCRYRTKRIEMSAYYVKHNSDESIRDTLLHEIAHALAGHAAGHGPVWQAIATRIGAKPERCDTSPDTKLPPGQFKATCPQCAKVFTRIRAPKARATYTCKCSPTARVVFEWLGFERPPSATPPADHPWRAECPACHTIHTRKQPPKPGRWTCRCPTRAKITWKIAGQDHSAT